MWRRNRPLVAKDQLHWAIGSRRESAYSTLLRQGASTGAEELLGAGNREQNRARSNAQEVTIGLAREDSSFRMTNTAGPRSQIPECDARPAEYGQERSFAVLHQISRSRQTSRRRRPH